MRITNKYEKRIIGDEVLLLPINGNGLKEALILNGFSSELYELIEKGTQMEEILHLISNKYEVDYNTLNKDIKDFLNILTDKKVVTD